MLKGMRDSELTDRPGKGWAPSISSGVGKISRVWWAAKELHFANLNVTVWFDGSDLVAIEHWGFRDPKWCMKNPPAGWQPMPAGYHEAAEAAWWAWHEGGGRRPAPSGRWRGCLRPSLGHQLKRIRLPLTPRNGRLQVGS